MARGSKPDRHGLRAGTGALMGMDGITRQARRNKRRKALTVLSFLSLWLVGFASLFVYAIGQTLYYSFTNYNLMSKATWVGLENYTHLIFHDAVFWTTLGNTGFFVVILVPGILILSFALAFLVNRKTWVANASSVAFFLPFIIPLAATGLVWRWMFNGEYGVVNYLLSLIHVEGPNWLTSSGWVKPSIAIAELTLVGQYMIIFAAALQDVPKALYEAADIDGASAWKKILSVSIPMVSPAILFNFVTCLIAEFQIFEIPYVMTLNGGSSMQAKASGGPGWSSTTFAMYMYDKMFSDYDAGTATAMAIISLVIVLLISLPVIRLGDRFVNYER
jgi:multiple sugar transport system permease protein